MKRACRSSVGMRRPIRRGFTLIELMVVVAIVAVLASIALPSYRRYVVDARRKAAAACAMEGAQFMERFYTTNLRYDLTTAGVAVALPASTCRNDLATFYTISLTGVAARAYTVQAVPQGAQATSDTKCGTMSVNQTGVKAVSGTDTVAHCW